MKTEDEILKVGDKILTKIKEMPNSILTQLNKNESISYNTGFYRGFVCGWQESVKTCNKPAVSVPVACRNCKHYEDLFDCAECDDNYDKFIATER